MDEETETFVITQPLIGDERQAFRHAGSDCDPPIAHRFEGGVTHRTDQPVVRMHLWDQDCVGKLDGQVVVRGDRDAPITFEHRFADELQQSHRIQTKLAEPIHHALQMRTPLQVRFCNVWQVASDYSVGIDVAGRRLIDIRLTGATVATPLRCDDDCAAPAAATTPASGPVSDIRG
ncbi:hypothetical protein U1763_00055 [Sphingomonas sp. LB2R24]|uniref:hypothetical protein n=1 Tax=Sphingomonas sorbitolis TaxID=3096165 RepID=UPI002FCB8D07